MGHEFSEHHEAEFDASPEQVWLAIAKPPGRDSWFIGRNFVEPGVGGQVRTDFGGRVPDATITGWEPPRRLAYRSEETGDGRFTAEEFLIEERGQGRTVLRLSTSGFLLGDDWEAEYEGVTRRGELFWASLVAYLTHFGVRHQIAADAAAATASGVPVSDWEWAWARLHRAIGLTGPVSVGDRVRFARDRGRLRAFEGVVYFTDSRALGVRTDDALYRFMRDIDGSMLMIAPHLIFWYVDEQWMPGQVWKSWLRRVLSPEGEPPTPEPDWRSWLRRVFGG